MQIGIVADDLTGAADALAPFARRGWQASVGFEMKHATERFPLDAGDVLAYDTATRDRKRDQSASIQTVIRRATRRLLQLQAPLVFKKIDSTLRGHLRLELDAMRQELAGRLVIVCPAFPANRRTVQSGVLHIDNVPWTNTEFAPVGMFPSLTVRGAFGMGEDSAAAELSMSDIRQSADRLEARLAELAARGVEIVFCDAAQQTDLVLLAQAMLRQPQRYFPVGSAGLAAAFAEALPPTGIYGYSLEKIVQPFVNGRVLVIVGSLHSVSRQQAQVLSERLNAPPVSIEAADGGDLRRQMESAAEAIREQFAEGRSIVTLITSDAPDAAFAENFAWLPGSIAKRVCARGLRTGQKMDGLIVCGGDTAAELCRAFNGTGLQIDGEWQPGVAVGRLKADPDPIDALSFDGLPIITKAGGFGDAHTLARCVGMV